MATFFRTANGSQYVLDGSNVMRHGVMSSSFDNRWWPVKAVSEIVVGLVVNIEIVDSPDRSHVFQTGRVDEIWYAGVA